MRVKAGTREGDVKWYSSIRSIVSQQCERASSIASHAAGHPILYSGGICVVDSGSTESCQAANLSAVVGLLWDLTPINILSERESCDFLWHLAVGPPVSVNSRTVMFVVGEGDSYSHLIALVFVVQCMFFVEKEASLWPWSGVTLISV